MIYNAQWYWEYMPKGNQWHLHTPGYEPEVSMKVGLHEGSVISAFHRATTLPLGVKEILAKMLPYLDLYAQSNNGITKILISRDEVGKAVKRIDLAREILTDMQSIKEI